MTEDRQAARSPPSWFHGGSMAVSWRLHAAHRRAEANTSRVRLGIVGDGGGGARPLREEGGGKWLDAVLLQETLPVHDARLRRVVVCPPACRIRKKQFNREDGRRARASRRNTRPALEYNGRT